MQTMLSHFDPQKMRSHALPTFRIILLAAFCANHAVQPTATINTPPVFTQSMDNLQISEDTPPGTVIYKLDGTDDQARQVLSYSLSGGNGVFVADSTTGDVILLQQLQHAVQSEYGLMVSVVDNGNPPMTTTKAIKVFVGKSLRAFLNKKSETANVELGFSVKSADVDISEDWPANVSLPFLNPIQLNIPPKMEDKQFELFVLSRNARVAGAFLISPARIIGSGPFSILLSDTSILDLEADDSPGNTLRIEVEALEPESGLSTRIPVLVNILDVNDHYPSFVEDSYFFRIPKFSKNGQKIGQLKVNDMDEGQFGAEGIVFNVTGQYSKFVRTQADNNENNSGMISLYLGCDEICDLPSSFSFVVRATDAFGKGLYSEVGIDVGMEDKDTSSPRFTSSLYVRTLVEHSTEFSPMLQVKAEDADNSELSYSLEDPTALFKIESKTGIVYVEYPDFVQLDNLGQSFNITAIASDGHNLPARTTILINIQERPDKRNEAPVFDQKEYNFTVAPRERYVGMISANDAEGEVTYKLSEGGAGYFQIGRDNGSLVYTGPTPLRSQSHTLRVVTMDDSMEGKVGFAAVNVIVEGLNSVQPEFIDPNVPQVNIREDSPAGSIIWTWRGTDGDENAYLVYKVLQVRALDRHARLIEDREFDSLFVFGGRGFSNGSLYLSREIGDSEVMSFIVRMSLMDASNANEAPLIGQLLIHVKPLSAMERLSKEPLDFMEIGSSQLSVPENLPIGSYVFTALLKPSHGLKNERVQYSMLSGGEYLSINEQTGVVKTREELDDVRMINATVEVAHPSSSRVAQTTYLIPVNGTNNHVPQFEMKEYMGEVSEGAELDEVVRRVIAVDPDGDKVNYSIYGPHSDYFNIDQQGTLTVAQELDREMMSALYLYVQGSDQDMNTATVPVRIDVLDVNDNSPKLSQKKYAAEIMENTPIGSTILHIHGKDADIGRNGMIEYSLIGMESEDLKEALTIDPADGIISNIKSLRGLHGEHSFGVVGSDGGGNNVASVVFLIIRPTHSCHPTFKAPAANKTIIKIKENANVGTVVSQVIGRTEDPSCPIQYAMWDSAVANYSLTSQRFDIDPESGVIRTNGPLDAEMINQYQVIVAVNSHSLYSQTLLQIVVEDINDNVPAFPFSKKMLNVPENVNVGQILYTAKADDHDIDENGRIFYHLVKAEDESTWDAMNKFGLDVYTGQLRLKEGLDKERVDQYEMWILASNTFARPRRSGQEQIWADGGRLRKDIMRLTIVLQDFNDNGPVFLSQKYEIAIPAQAPIGSLITIVKAIDGDKKMTDQTDVSYSMGQIDFVFNGLRSGVEGLVKVDDMSGRAIVGKSLAPYVDGLISAQIYAQDSANASSMDSTILNMWVYDPSQVVRVIAKEKPQDITRKQAQSILKWVGDKSGGNGILSGVERHVGTNGMISNDKVDILGLFVNRSSMAILPVQKVLKQADLHGHALRDDQHNILFIKGDQDDGLKIGRKALLTPAAISLIVFAVILFFGLIGFGLLLCYLRYSFIREKKVMKRAEQAEKDRKRATLPPLPLPAIHTAIKENPLWMNGGGVGPYHSRSSTLNRPLAITSSSEMYGTMERPM